MAEEHLGETIDIHGGGQDLVFPHHENEIAQSVCAHGGKPFARYWLHNGFVTVNRQKMSKSLGNTLVVHELLEEVHGEVLRYQLLTAHYRQPLDWSDDALRQSRRTLDRMCWLYASAIAAPYGELPSATDSIGQAGRQNQTSADAVLKTRFGILVDTSSNRCDFGNQCPNVAANFHHGLKTIVNPRVRASSTWF